MNVETLLAPPRLDSAHAHELERQFEEVIHAGRYAVVLSLRDTIFLSSAGIRALLVGSRNLRKLGGSLSLVEVSPATRAVLETSGLLSLLGTGPVSAGDKADARAQQQIIETERLHVELESLMHDAVMSVQAVGNGQSLHDGPVDINHLQTLRVTPDLCGVGLGAFGVRDETCGVRVGEWMAACGVAISLPPDSQSVDYMISAPHYQPDSLILHALSFPGRFSRFARFSARAPHHDARLSDLVDAALSWNTAPAIGFLLMGESSGLVGATLAASPLQSHTEDFFAHPGIRERLSLTPEPEHNGELALVAGLVCRGEPVAAWRPCMRTLDADRSIQAHLHAAVFSYTAIPAGRIQPDAFIRQLVSRERIRTLLHLLTDARPNNGVGESRFHNGLIWTCPLEVVP